MCCCRAGRTPIRTSGLSTTVLIVCLLSAALCELSPPAVVPSGHPQTAPVPSEPPQTACSLRRDRGRRCSRGPSLRWYLDEDQGDCLSFWYGGCDGNANNFHTRSECENQCVAAPATPSDVSVNEIAQPNTTVSEPNVTDTEQDITSAERVNITSPAPPTTTVTSPSTAAPRSKAPRRRRPVPGRRAGRRGWRGRRTRLACLRGPGACYTHLPGYYYYNADLGTCQASMCGGYRGRPNRFITKEACEMFCKGVRRRAT